MKVSYMKKICPCFGKKKMFFKEKLKDCIYCSFKHKCLLKVSGGDKNGKD